VGKLPSININNRKIKKENKNSNKWIRMGRSR
jgi:hypothetical protein